MTVRDSYFFVGYLFVGAAAFASVSVDVAVRSPAPFIRSHANDNQPSLAETVL